MQLLKSLSPHVAIAISQTHLEQKVNQQIRYQNLMNQLTNAIRNAWELEQIFQLTVEGMAVALQVQRSLILSFKYMDPLHRNRPTAGIPKAKVRIAAEWLDASAQLPATASTMESHPQWVADCLLCQHLIKQAEPIAIPDSTVIDSLSDTRFHPDAVAPFFQVNTMPSLLIIPLENQGTLLGGLVLQHQEYRTWSAEDMAFAKLVAAQLSTAIIQSRTLQQIQSVVQERTAQLQRSLEVQAKLYEKTRQQVEQLRRLNEEREEFLSTVSHELRTPLTSMTLAIRMLRQDSLSPERREQYLDILEQQCIQETQLINDLLALRKLETVSTTTQLQRLDIRYLIRDIAQSIEPTLRTFNWHKKN